MPLSFGEKVKILLKRRNMTITELATILGTSRQNLTNKLSRDNFPEKEMLEISQKLNCTYKGRVIMNDTGDEL
jgi:transcriptional regulator with XRE-family HTH domain